MIKAEVTGVTQLEEITEKELYETVRKRKNWPRHHALGLKLSNRLRLGLSHLRERKFRHNFNDTINPFCCCGTNSNESA